MDALSDTRRMAKDIHKKNVRSQSHGSSWRKRKGGVMGEIEVIIKALQVHASAIRVLQLREEAT